MLLMIAQGDEVLIGLRVGLTEMTPITKPLPCTRLRYILRSHLRILSFPHTYLVKVPVLKKTGNYDSSPALHSAEASVIEWPSGPSFAQFLMVFLSFHQCPGLVLGAEEENRDSNECIHRHQASLCLRRSHLTITVSQVHVGCSKLSLRSHETVVPGQLRELKRLIILLL